MRKLIFILFLLFVNFYLLYSKISSTDIEDVKLQLEDDEVGIVILYLESSTSLLIQKEEMSILYVLDYINDNNLYETIELFFDRIDYVFMREEHDLKYPYKVVVDGSILIGGMHIERNKIHYKEHTFCIDVTDDCDYIYLTKEVSFEDNVETILYNSYIPPKFIDKLHDDWVDIYKVKENEYTILILEDDDYEIIKLKG